MHKDHGSLSEVEHQFQQSGANKMQNNVSGTDKREDSDRSYVELLRAQASERHEQGLRFSQDKHDQDMAERRYSVENMRHGLNKLVNLDPSEAKAQSEVLSGVQLEAIKTIVVRVLAESGK